MWEIRETAGRPKVKRVKRKFLTFKTSKSAKKRPAASRRSPPNPGSGGREGSGGVHGAVTAAALLKNNQQLAAVLNSAKVQNAALSAKISDLNGEILDLRMQNTQLKQEIKLLKQLRHNDVNPQLEYQLQQRLLTYGAYIEPLMKNLSDALDHTVGLSNTLSLSMKLATGLDRQQKSFTQNPNSSPSGSPVRVKNTKTAQIKPMVKGHSISKPSVRMARLDLNDLQPLNVTSGPVNRQERERQENPVSLEEEEPLVLEESPRRQGTLEAAESPPIISRQRQRRLRLQNIEARQLRNVADISDVLEDESEGQQDQEEEGAEEEEERDVEGRGVAENTVLLIPRLVLERVTIESPRKSPSSGEDDDKLMRRRRSRNSVNLVTPSSSPNRLANPYQDWDMDDSFARNSSLFDSPVSGGDGDNSGSALGQEEEDGVETPLRRSSRKLRSSIKPDTPCRIFDDSKDGPEIMASPSVRRESTEDFMQRVMSMDPLEGPSWLFDDKGNRRKNPPKIKKSRGSSRSCGSRKETKSETSTPTMEKGRGDSGGPADAPSVPSLVDGDRRSSRRAAAKAVGSLKEPSTTKKLRQGDPTSSSIYSRYVPETKGRKRVSSKSEGQAKRPKLSDE